MRAGILGRAARAAGWAAALAAALALAACAPPPPKGGTKVTLLPQADGSASAAVLTTAAGETRIDTPYESATAREGDKTRPATAQGNAAEVRAAYGQLLDVAPPKPERFVVFFQTGGTQLTAESQLVMNRVLDEALKRSGAELVIIGHTDTKGKADANDALSLRRADQVKQMFVQRGFAPARIESAGRGERELAVPTADEVDEPRNRRVEILVR